VAFAFSSCRWRYDIGNAVCLLRQRLDRNREFTPAVGRGKHRDTGKEYAHDEDRAI
jgi:hypothetical protein